MRFAEHMLLEAKNYSLAPYLRESTRGERCALGLVEGKGIEQNAEHRYPWITSTYAPIPCECAVSYCNAGNAIHATKVPVVMGIVHLFNEHVMQGRKQLIYGVCFDKCKPWTMEQLADWINSVDPTPDDQKEKKEPEEEEEPDNLPAAVTLCK